jgi:hypothetical protein
MRIRTKVASALSAFGLTAAALAMGGTPAQATASSNCDPVSFGPMCYYFHSGYTGGRAGIVPAVNDLYSWTFSGGTGSNTGNGQAVANNSGSGSNRDRTCTSLTWPHVGGSAGGGNALVLSPYPLSGYQNSTLGALNNDNRSLAWRC